MIQFDLFTLKLFVAVGEELTICKAADRVGIVASAASKRISDLELLLETPLLCRQSRGVKLTPAGEALFYHARSVFRSLEQMEGELSEYKQGIKGHVRVFANLTSMVHFLPDELSAFSQKYPLIKINLEEHLSPAVVRAVVESQTDIGIFSGNVPSQSLELFPYHDDRLALVVPSGHPLADSKDVRFKAILDYDIVSLPQDSAINQLIYREAGKYNRLPKIRFHVTSFDAACRMVQSGLGISIIPEVLAKPSERIMRIRAVTLREAWATRTLFVGVREYRVLSVTARLLVDHLVQGRPAIVKREG